MNKTNVKELNTRFNNKEGKREGEISIMIFLKKENINHVSDSTSS